MCNECSPAGRFLMSSVILTPLGAGASVAVPTLCPCAFLMSTITGFGLAFARLSCTHTAPAADKNSTAQTSAFIMVLLAAYLDLGFDLSRKIFLSQSSLSRERAIQLVLKQIALSQESSPGNEVGESISSKHDGAGDKNR